MSRVSAKRATVRIIAGGAIVLAAALVVVWSIGLVTDVDASEWLVPMGACAAIALVAWGALRTTDSESSGDSERHCPSCGRPVLGDWRLCPYCGAFMETAFSSAERPERTG